VTPDGLEEHFYFGGGSASSTITPLGIVILILACLAILALKRRWLFVPFIVVSLLIPVTQVIYLLGAHVSIWRSLIFVAWARIGWAMISKSDPFPGPLTSLDKVFALWALSNALIYTILWSDVGALLNRAGFLFTSIGTYFLFRYLIRDRDDVIRVVRVLALVLVPIAIGMAVEHWTTRNLFAVLGTDEISGMRDGRVRAQGPFLHAIIAGTVGAVLMPLFVGLWAEGKGHRLRSVLGTISATVMMITSSSSTPLMSYAAAAMALCLWPFRRKMRTVRYIVLGILAAIQLTMHAPIWYLMNRVSGVVGGTGWHRADLIDQFVRRFFEWWLIGTRDNANWGLDMWDAINGYVRAGVEGGLLTFSLFLALIIIGFRRIGLAMKTSYEQPANERLLFCLGATLFGNAVAFLGIIYFDQSVIVWYLTIAVISGTTALVLNAAKTEEPVDDFIPVRPSARKVNKQRAPVEPVATYRRRLGVQNSDRLKPIR
jgi:hypothetical protein